MTDDGPEDNGGSYSINFERFVGRDYMLYDKNKVQGNNGEQGTFYCGVAPAPLVYPALQPIPGGEGRTVRVTGDGVQLPNKTKGVVMAIREDDPPKVGFYNIAKNLREEITLAQVVAGSLVKVDKSIRDGVIQKEIEQYMSEHIYTQGSSRSK